MKVWVVYAKRVCNSDLVVLKVFANQSAAEEYCRAREAEEGNTLVYYRYEEVELEDV